MRPNPVRGGERNGFRARSHSRSKAPERQPAGPLNSHPIMRFESPSDRKQARQTDPCGQPQRHQAPRATICSPPESESNLATVHSDDYDLPMPRVSVRPSRREGGRLGHGDDQEGHGYIPSVSSILLDDVISVNTVSSCTNPPFEHNATNPSRRSFKSRGAHLAVHGSQATSVGREAARAGWEQRSVSMAPACSADVKNLTRPRRSSESEIVDDNTTIPEAPSAIDQGSGRRDTRGRGQWLAQDG